MSTIIAPAPVPTPALLSRPAPAERRRSFDIASEIGNTAVAWCIRDQETGEQEKFFRPRVRGEEVLGTLMGEVIAWVEARAGEQPVTLRCFSIALREAAIARLDPARFLTADLISLNTSAEWAHQARAVLREELTRSDRAEFFKRVMYGASDGSVHPVYGNGAYAWVTSDGKWKAARSRANILTSEVLAILSFVEHFEQDRSYYRAVLFVDSLSAISAVTTGAHVHRRIDPDLAAVARSLIASGRLELIWVRGHRGHILNDLADRLALQRHRAVRTKLSSAQLDALCEGIVEGAAESLATTDWRLLARDARNAYRSHMRVHDQAA